MSRTLIIGSRRRGKASAAGSVVPFFADNLAGGNTTNANGFVWDKPVDILWAVSPDYAVNGGTHSIKLTFGPDAPETHGLQGKGNIGFSFAGYGEVSELWMEWQFRLPENYVHRELLTLPENNKLLHISRAFINNGNSWRTFIVLDRNTDTITNIRGFSSTFDSFSTAHVAPAVQAMGPGLAINTGVWTRMRIHLKAASSAGATDGVYELWANDTLLVQVTNAKFWNHSSTAVYGDAMMSVGYFMGASNSGFTDPTSFYLADFKFYDINPGWT